MIYLFSGFIGLLAGLMIVTYLNIGQMDTLAVKEVCKGICHKPLNIVIEAAVIAVFEYIFYCISGPLNIARYSFLTCILVTAALQDIKDKRISNRFIVFTLAGSILFTLASLNVKTVINSTILFAATFGALSLLYFLSRGGIGFGDVKLLTSLSILLKVNGFLSVLAVAIILSGVFSLILMIVKRVNRKETIPFTPFVLVSILLLLNYF